jgi:carnitine O-acetyltransferase
MGALNYRAYHVLVAHSRYPVKPSDTARKFDPKKKSHIAVVCKNKLLYLSQMLPGVNSLLVQQDH